MYSSRQAVAAKQRTSSYHPSGAIASHVLNTTVAIESEESVLDINGSYWCKSKFYHRYYRVVVENGVWFCSASDERVAKQCKQAVQAYLEALVPENGTVQVPSKSKPGTYHTLTIRNGKAVGCDCDERKAVGIEKYGFKACHHMTQHNDRVEFNAKTAQAEQARAEESARYNAYRQQRDEEAYEKRLAFLASQKTA